MELIKAIKQQERLRKLDPLSRILGAVTMFLMTGLYLFNGRDAGVLKGLLLVVCLACGVWNLIEYQQIRQAWINADLAERLGGLEARLNHLEEGSRDNHG